MEYNLPGPQATADIAWIASTLQPIERLHSPVWVYDVDYSRVLWCNQSSLDMWQAESRQELLSREVGANMSLSVSKRLKQYKADFENDAQAQFREIWTLYPNGKPATLDVVFSPFRLNTGRMCMFCEVVGQKSIDNQALRSSEALLHTSVNISLYAASGEPLYRNPAARSKAVTSDCTLDQYFENQELIERLQNSENDEVKAVTRVRTVHGDRWHDITARRCTDAVSGNAAWLISEVDVSRLKATEERAQFLAEHDTLTSLPNRNYVSIYFQACIEEMLSQNKAGALVFIDLDNFKDVNDSLGHDAGDQLLVEVSNRLLGISDMPKSVARLGGDEFLLLTDLSNDDGKMEKLAEQIIATVSRPIVIQHREIRVTPSIGVALFPNDGITIRELMRHADLAMYAAKDIGKNGVAFYTHELNEAVQTRISLEADIRRALRNNEFTAFFQARVNVVTGTVVGAEALARWRHPDYGMMLPDVFIPACEKSGLIGELGKIIFTQTVIAQRKWAEKGHDLRLSVNLSPLQFAEPDLVDQLIQIVEQYDGNPQKIELEITESVLLGNDQETIDKLHQLVRYGFHISIDDFGTGYSSLAYLHRYPISCLKIDRSFIQSIATATPIVELVISMANLFEMYVVAEGVEKSEQLDVLREYQCEEYQGFLFKKPVSYKRFTHLITVAAQCAA